MAFKLLSLKVKEVPMYRLFTFIILFTVSFATHASAPAEGNFVLELGGRGVTQLGKILKIEQDQTVRIAWFKQSDAFYIYNPNEIEKESVVSLAQLSEQVPSARPALVYSNAQVDASEQVENKYMAYRDPVSCAPGTKAICTMINYEGTSVALFSHRYKLIKLTNGQAGQKGQFMLMRGY